MLNGRIMSGDKVTASVVDDEVIITDAQHCPLYLQKHNDVNGWLRGRAIDAHRTNSRLLRKALRLAPNDDVAAVLRVHGATITDHYWFLPEGSDLTYEQIRFTENEFSELALYGDPDSFQRGSERAKTPELTNTGSFEKCWKLIDGDWWMYKSGSQLELFSELFVFHFGELLGLNMAQYDLEGSYIRSRDFTQSKTDFEPIYSIMLDEEDYLKNYRLIRSLCPKAAAEYVGMIYLDALVLNMDRHTNNYGFLRSPETGELLSLAPLFDHNVALISRGYPTHAKRGGDLLQKLFVDFLNEEPQAIKDFLSLKLKTPTGALVSQAMAAVCSARDWGTEIRKDFIQEMILSASEWIESQIPEISVRSQGISSDPMPIKEQLRLLEEQRKQERSDLESAQSKRPTLDR